MCDDDDDHRLPRVVKVIIIAMYGIILQHTHIDLKERGECSLRQPRDTQATYVGSELQFRT